MKVIKITFKPTPGAHFISRAEAEVVEKPFSWVIKNKVYSLPDTIDTGSIDENNIPIALFDNWLSFGHDDKKSSLIPSDADFFMDGNANSELRMFGTINMIDSLRREDFEAAEKGICGYLQMLLKTYYISPRVSFDRLVKLAQKTLSSWDEISLKSFCANVCGKTLNNVSLQDIVYVVNTIMKTEHTLEGMGFTIENIYDKLPLDKACEEKPDEFFCAAFPSEFLELAIAKSLLVYVDNSYYFGSCSSYPQSWKVTGDGGVKWLAKINIDHKRPEEATVDWAPMAGTLFSRAIDSKNNMNFATKDEAIPFRTSLSNCEPLDSDRYLKEPGDFKTGLRYLSVDQDLEICSLTVPAISWNDLGKSISSYGMDNTSPATMCNGLVNLYARYLPDIELVMGNRHFIGFSNNLSQLKDKEEDVEEIKYIEKDSSNLVNLPRYMLGGVDSNIRSILCMAWVYLHTDSDTICSSNITNSYYTIQSVIAYITNISCTKSKVIRHYLINCIYSDRFNRAKVKSQDVVGLNTVSFDFG